MSDPIKFTFDHEFDRDGNTIRARAPRPKTRFTREELEHARAEGFENGQSSAQVEATKTTNATLQSIAGQLSQIIETLNTEVDTIRAEGARIAFESARCLAGGLIDNNPSDYINQIISECLSTLRDRPTLTISVAPDLLPTLSQQIEALASQAGFSGQISVEASESADKTRCMITWSNGGALSDFETQAEGIKSIIADHLQAQGNTQLNLFEQ